MLRCLIVRQRGLELGHDLREHLKQARDLGMFQRSEDDAVADAVNELAVIWRNDLRFTGSARFAKQLHRTGRNRRIRGKRVVGDPEKANAHSVLNAAEIVVSRGERVCTSKRK